MTERKAETPRPPELDALLDHIAEDGKRRPGESDNAFLARIIFGAPECGYQDALGRFCHKPARHQGRHQHGA